MNPVKTKIVNGTVAEAMKSTRPRNVDISPRARSTKITGTRITWVGMNMPEMKNSSAAPKTGRGERAMTYAAGAHTPMETTLTQMTNPIVTA